jgi:hypothetical protein
VPNFQEENLSMKRKTQMEMMGLVVIIVLIALILLFVIQFIILKEPTSARTAYAHSKLSANTLNTLLKTTTECQGLSTTQLLQDCSNYYLTPSEQANCNGQTSCQYVENEIGTMLENSLEQWKVPYNFTVHLIDREVKITKSYGDCSGERKSAFQPLSQPNMNIRLDICT